MGSLNDSQSEGTRSDSQVRLPEPEVFEEDGQNFQITATLKDGRIRMNQILDAIAKGKVLES